MFIKKIVYYSQFLRGEGMPCPEGPPGEASGLVMRLRAGGGGGTVRTNLYCGFHGREWVRQSKQV